MVVKSDRSDRSIGSSISDLIDNVSDLQVFMYNNYYQDIFPYMLLVVVFEWKLHLLLP